MYLDEFETFCKSPNVENAMKFGQKITELDFNVYKKREMFAEAFDCSFSEEIEAAVNLWAVAAMLEDDQLDITRKISAVRSAIRDPYTSIEQVETWAWVVWGTNRVDKETLDFLAVDVRNLNDISSELQKMLEQK